MIRVSIQAYQDNNVIASVVLVVDNWDAVPPTIEVAVTALVRLCRDTVGPPTNISVCVAS